MKQVKTLVFLFALTALVLVPNLPVFAQGSNPGTHWCGNSTEDENFGFNFGNGQVDHWTINGEGYVSQQAIDQVDQILDQLHADNIANTMILFIDSDDVAVGGSCAGQFLDHMNLGNYDGPRADNGFAWVFNYNRASDTLQIHYSVGGSLNALLTSDLKPMKRFGQDTYAQTKNMDTTLIETIKAFDQYARSKYEPYHPSEQTPPNEQAPTTSLPPFVLYCLLCFVVIGFLVIVYLVIKYGSSGTTTTRSPSPGTPYTPRPQTPQRRPQPRKTSQSRPISKPATRRSGGGSGKSQRVG